MPIAAERRGSRNPDGKDDSATEEARAVTSPSEDGDGGGGGKSQVSDSLRAHDTGAGPDRGPRVWVDPDAADAGAPAKSWVGWVASDMPPLPPLPPLLPPLSPWPTFTATLSPLKAGGRRALAEDASADRPGLALRPTVSFADEPGNTANAHPCDADYGIIDFVRGSPEAGDGTGNHIFETAGAKKRKAGCLVPRDTAAGASPLKKRKVAHPAPSGNAKKKRSKASSDTAARREFDKFVRWLPCVTPPDAMLTELSGIDRQHVGQDFIDFGRRMKDKAVAMGMKAGQASRVQHVLMTSDTFAELYCKTLLCFVPIKGGFADERKGAYDLKHCSVCKGAGLLQSSGHADCPYCHACFAASGWKKTCVRKEDCQGMH